MNLIWWIYRMSKTTYKIRPRTCRKPSIHLTLEMLEGRETPSVITVTSNADSGPGTLRQAILTANGQTGLTTIDFAINSGLQTIAPLTALPAITQPVVIDGTSQPGFDGTPLIVLTGGSLPFSVAPSTPGLDIEVNSCTIKDLVINGFQENDLQLSSNGNLVEGNFIGTNASGTGFSDVFATNIGINVTGSDNTIGGTASSAKNLVSGCYAGISLNLVGSGSHNVVQGNYIGTDITGTMALSNTFGVMVGANELESSITFDTIGGTVAGSGNLISGNTLGGAYLSTGGIVEGNLIGTNATGTVSLPNSVGVFIEGGSNTVGGTVAGAGNVIAGNSQTGVQVGRPDFAADATGNVIQGNWIGTNASNASGLGNGMYGVDVSEGSNNTIGGTATGAGNIIGDNGEFGVQFSNDTTGNLLQGNSIGVGTGGTAIPNMFDGVAILNSSGNTVGGTATGAGNVIADNGQFGVILLSFDFETDAVSTSGAATSNNVIEGNDIGTNAAGAAGMGNTLDGIAIFGAADNTIGGTASGAGNVLAGNGRFGVYLSDASTTGNMLEGNLIGVNAAGTVLANTFDGVALLQGAASNTLGGTTAGAGNTIAGNGRFGVLIGTAGTSDNVLQGNFIGTNAAGGTGLGNTLDGVALIGATGNTIGGTAAGAGNALSGNDRFGAYLDGTGTNDNVLEGNLIGLDAAGTVLANTFDGVALLDGAASNTVGGTVAGAGNTIAGNGRFGVLLGSAGTTGNVLEGNFIGTNAAGGAGLGNVNSGVKIVTGAAGNTVGGTTSGAGNTIAFNGNSGVVVGGSADSIDNTTVGDSILGNTIFGNLGTHALGIDLNNDGVTANGPAGNDRSGPNDLQNYPVFTPALATVANGNASATITFSSLANSTFRLEFFLNDVTDLPAQGRTFLGAITVTTDASGNLATATSASSGVSVGTVTGGTVQVTLPLPSGTTTGSLTATATAVFVPSGLTGTLGDTSEFSAPAALAVPG